MRCNHLKLPPPNSLLNQEGATEKPPPREGGSLEVGRVWELRPVERHERARYSGDRVDRGMESGSRPTGLVRRSPGW